jgi:hypothetical protein
MSDAVTRGLQAAIAASRAMLKKDTVSMERQAKESQRQEREAMVDVRKAIRQFEAPLPAVVEEHGGPVLTVVEMVRTKRQLGAEVGGLKLQGEVP